MISGLFIAFAVTKYGQERFRRDMVNLEGTDLRVGPAFSWVLTYLVPVEFAVMFGWWVYQSVAVYDPAGWWNPIHTYSIGTCVAQWTVALALLVAFNRQLARASLREPAGMEARP
jgi:NSS family neurotransmitter:Na+ symporter